MTRTTDTDNSLLEAALLGYQSQLADIMAKIADIQRRLGGPLSARTSAPSGTRPNKKHIISAEGRARIAAAQRKRWAAAKKAAS
jgi:hypothetical protein